MNEPLEASVTLEDIFAVVTAKRAPLAPELAGYLALEIAETSPAREGSVDTKLVWVGEEGTVAVMKPREETPTGAEETIRILLGKLLDAGGSHTPALMTVARKKAGGGLSALIEELEAALIPVNRAAGRRALARLAREVKRVTMGVGRNAMRSQSSEAEARPSASMKAPPAATTFEEEENPTTATRDIPPEVLAEAPRSDDKPADIGRISQSELPTVGISAQQLKVATGQSKRDSVDSLLDKFEVTGQKEDKALSRELKAIAGLDPTPGPPPLKPGENVELADDGGVDALLGATTEKAPVPQQKSKPRPPSPSYSDDRQLPTGPMVSRRGKKKGGFLFPLVIVIFILTAGACVLWMLKPGFFTGRTPEKIAEEKRLAEEAEKARLAAQNKQPACKASIVVSGAPDGSEILVRAGTAPIDIDRMPVGPRLEVVATLDGHAPRRAVVPAGAQWEKGADGKPRFEVAVQLDKSKKPPGMEGWPPADPGSEVGGKGDPGVVHVVSTPKGAEVWVVAGVGPDARIDELVRCDTDAEILIAGPTTYRRRVSVKAGDFTPDPAGSAGVRIANIAVPKK
jgi:hypothetical protein